MNSRRVAIALLLLALASGIFLSGWQLAGDDSARVWQAFLVNLLFFSGIAQAGPVLAAIYYLTEGRWGAPVMRLCLGLGWFLPVSLLLFAVLFAGFPYLPTGSPESPARQTWFSLAFFSGRDLVALGLLYSVSLVFTYRFLGLLSQGPRDDRNDYSERSSTGRPPSSVHERRAESSLTGLASLVLGLYAVVFSLIGFDLVMALDDHWYSTLFGGYFFMSSFYAGLAAITIIAVLAKGELGRDEAIEETHLWDLGKLLFAFCILTAYFVWSQFLVIWYGNLPEEVGFFMLRMKNNAWTWLTWATLILIFAIPFVALLSQRAKQSPVVLFLVGSLVLIGLWLERYLLIVPSLAVTEGVLIGWIEAIVTLAFLAALITSYGVYSQILLPRWARVRVSG